MRPVSSRLGLELLRLPVQGPGDFHGAFQAATRDRTEALFVVDDALITRHRAEILDLAARHALPVVSRGKWFQGMTLIPWLAAKTEKVRIGMSIIDTPFRSPGVLAAVLRAKPRRRLPTALAGAGTRLDRLVAQQGLAPRPESGRRARA